MKRVLALAIVCVFVLSMPCVVFAESLASKCDIILKYISEAVTPHFEYKVSTRFLYETDTARAYNLNLVNGEEDHDIQVVFSKTKDGKSFYNFTAVFYIEDCLYRGDERFTQISTLIRSILSRLMKVQNVTDVHQKFVGRLEQYFNEESSRTLTHKSGDLTLYLEYMDDDFLVLVTLE